MNEIQTKYLTTGKEDLKIAGQIVAKGGLVAFPTETVYGLGANAMDSKAVANIYKAKGRPSDNPIIIHIATIDDLEKVVILENETDRKIVELLAKNFWQGALTMVLPKNKNVPDKTTGGLETVAVRIPDSKVALEIIKNAGVPIAAPSANISGRPSPTIWQHVADDMTGKIDAIVKGDRCTIGIESTVVEIKNGKITILRPGFVTVQDIERTIANLDFHVKVTVDKGILSTSETSEKQKSDTNKLTKDFQPKSPGMKYRHYAPKGQVFIIKGEAQEVKRKMEQLEKMYQEQNKKVGIITFAQEDITDSAYELFYQLREMDDLEKEIILIEAIDDNDGIGFAVMNRLTKAANGNVIYV